MAESLVPDGEPPRQTGKSPEAFRTIAEVAAELDVPQHVLRFWETRFPQVRPLKRGGGRRYYRPHDVETLRRIRNLLHNEGYTIRGAQRVLRADGSRSGTVEVTDAGPMQRDGSPLSPGTRAELRAVLAELEDLRRLINTGGS